MFRFKTVRGEPVTVGATTVTPVARRVAFSIRGERYGLGLSYDGPSHLDVSSPEGSHRVWIPDMTLITRLAVAVVVLTALVARRRS